MTKMTEEPQILYMHTYGCIYGAAVRHMELPRQGGWHPVLSSY